MSKVFEKQWNFNNYFFKCVQFGFIIQMCTIWHYHTNVYNLVLSYKCVQFSFYHTNVYNLVLIVYNLVFIIQMCTIWF